jgi:hypothetical protein
MLAEARAARGLPAPAEALVPMEEVVRESGRCRKTVMRHAGAQVVRLPGSPRAAWLRKADAARLVNDLRQQDPDGPDRLCKRCGEEFPAKFFTHCGNAGTDTCNACYAELYGPRRLVLCGGGCGRRFQTRAPEGVDALCRTCRKAGALSQVHADQKRQESGGVREGSQP